MNAAAEIMDTGPDIIEQALAGLDRRPFERAEQELRDADASIRSAEMNLHRLRREADEAKAAYGAWERQAAQAQLEGRTPDPYAGPDPTQAQRMFALGSDELAAMKIASQQAIARRAAAREALRDEVQRRLSAAYATLADSLVEVWNALELTGNQPIGQPYASGWARLAIPAAPGMPGDDTRLYTSAIAAARSREGIRAQIRGLAPEIVK
jgi:hypothetical protein